jgi:D-3-phosphoglycerate dehydrogenase
MYKILIVPHINTEGLNRIASHSEYTYELVSDTSEASLKNRIVDADAVILRDVPLGRSVLSAAERLQVVSRHGVGYDKVDLAYLTSRRIPLTITVNSNTVSVAEHTVMMILALAKNVLTYDRETRGGNFGIRDSLECSDVSEKTLLIIGFGRIGREVASRCIAFGMNVLVHDPAVPNGAVAAAGCTRADDLEQALPGADYVSIHVPLSVQTQGLIGSREIALMRPSCCLISTARGGVVDEAALYSALRDRRLRGAGLDVFEAEPPVRQNPLFELDNVLVTPHSAALTREAAERMAIASVDNVWAVLEKRVNPAVVVNPEVLVFL